MESKTLGFSISIYFMQVRCLLVKQSLTGSDINTPVRPEMFWRCPIWQVIAKLSSPGSWSTSWQVSQAPQPLGLETPAGVLAQPLPTCWKVEILGAWTPLWFPCLEALSGPAGAPELLPSLMWSGGFGQPSQGGPQHHGCAGARGAGELPQLLGGTGIRRSAAIAGDDVVDQSQAWELRNCVLMFLKWPFWEFPVCGHVQKSLFPAWFGPKPPIHRKPHFLQTGGLACRAALLLVPHLLCCRDELSFSALRAKVPQSHGLWGYHNLAITT